MNQAFSRLLNGGVRPHHVVLVTCLLIFLFADSRMTFWEHQAAPALTELHAGNPTAPLTGGIKSFNREYLSDPFGRAIGLSERQLELCRHLSMIGRAYESAAMWRDTALATALIALILLARQKWGARLTFVLRELGRNLRLRISQSILRRVMAQTGQRFSNMQQAVRQKRAPVKQAVVHNIVACPACPQKLRVPAGKSRIRVTCSGCGHRFETVT